VEVRSQGRRLRIRKGKKKKEKKEKGKESYLIKFVDVNFLQGVLAAELVELMMHPLED